MERFWVEHPVHIWIPCWLHDTIGDQVSLATDDGEAIVVPTSQLKSLSRVDNEQLEGVNDVCSLPVVNHGALLHTVRVRYLKQLIYTRVQRILISLNPFMSLPIYSSSYLDKYVAASDSMDLPPHIFGIGADAMKGLREGYRDQAVVISGESGAGKTESAKLIMSFVAEASSRSGGVGHIEEKVLKTNPVLEAFGNAMTVRNNNSSRFGKWLDMQFSGKTELLGCSIKQYLLETTRVCDQSEGERSFHIFFQMLQARNEPEMIHLKLLSPTAYNYLKNSQLVAPGIDDEVGFAETTDSFDELGFSKEEQADLYKILSAILWIGNCIHKRKTEEELEFKDEATVKQVAELLEVSHPDLMRSLLWRKIYAGKDVTETPLREDQAKGCREGLSECLYGLIFSWIVEKLNVSLRVEASGPLRLLGILDIAGFESFEKNSLEQLLINLSNEHLQQHFNAFIFKSELEDYAKEGITLSEQVDYVDNSDCLNLMDGRGGVLDQLDEELAVPKATDMTFVTKVLKSHAKDARLETPKFPGKPLFGIKHYAGTVMYTVDGWLEKNANKPPDEAMEVISKSKLKLAVKLVGMMREEDSAASSRTSRKKETGTSKFRTSLRSLILKINNADPHYIRCVKPNKEKVEHVFTSAMVMEQLTLSGSLEAVRIRQQGFASRQLFKIFVLRYRGLAQFDVKNHSETFEAEAKLLVEKLKPALRCKPALQSKDFAFGTTKVFTKAGALAALEAGRTETFFKSAVTIQSVARGKSTRRKMSKAKSTFASLKVWLTSNAPVAFELPIKSCLTAKLPSQDGEKALKELTPLLAKARELPYKAEVVIQADAAEKRLQQELEVMGQISNLLSSKSLENVPMDKNLARARDFGLDFTPDFKTLEQRSERLKVQLPLVQAFNSVIKGDTSCLSDIIAEVKKTGLDKTSKEWIEELDGPSLYEQVQKIAEEHQTSAQPEEKPPDSPSRQRSRSSRRSTLTGFGPVAQVRILHSLKQAADEYDAVALEELLSEAVRQGVAPNELEAASKLLTELQTDTFLLQAVEEAKAEATSVNPSAVVLRRLQNLSHQIRNLQGDEDVACSAMHIVQSATRKHTAAVKRSSVFEAASPEELQLADAAFKDLHNFKKLKMPKNWKGHRGSMLLSFMGGAQKDSMLSHCKHNIGESITQLTAEQEPDALKNFRNIMVWMGDKTAQECQRLASRHDVLNLACNNAEIRDEVYVQIMKQLTDNPSPRSGLMGWQLILLLCQAAPPSDELIEFIRYFLTNTARAAHDGEKKEATDSGGGASAVSRHSAEAAGYARECLAALNLKETVQDKRYSIRTVTKPEASNDKGSSEDVMAIVVHLVDGSSQHMYVPVRMTVGELAFQTGVRLGVRHASDFSFFQMLDGVDTPRLLPDHLVVPEMCEKWTQLKEASGRSSKLLWRRRFLRAEEVLLAGDLAHAALTFRQALTDFLHKPVQAGDDPDLPAKIGGAILCVEFDHGTDAQVQAKLKEDGFIEKLLPAYIMKDVTPRQCDQWRMQVLQAQKDLRPLLGAQTPQIQRMSRMLTLMQGTNLFGSHFWQARQTLSPPGNQIAVAGAPERTLKFNTLDLEADLYIFVNLHGVHLLPAQQNDKNAGLVRSFTFRGTGSLKPGEGKPETRRRLSSGSLAAGLAPRPSIAPVEQGPADRLLRWGARPTFLQLIVHAVDPSKPKEGRCPMLLTLMCAQSLDIAFVIHRAISEEALAGSKTEMTDAGAAIGG